MLGGLLRARIGALVREIARGEGCTATSIGKLFHEPVFRLGACFCRAATGSQQSRLSGGPPDRLLFPINAVNIQLSQQGMSGAAGCQ